ncbi:glycoside hydrolase family 99-like domain-containing protein [Alsobacter sp. R-9]
MSIQVVVGKKRIDVRKLLVDQNLFDEAYYLASHPDIREAGVDAFEHFFLYGHKEGRKPNPLFDPLWYTASNQDVASTDIQPLLHYVLYGESESRRPSPLFDPGWYRSRYGVAEGESCLGHYLCNRTGAFSPIPEFDAEYYLKTYKDVAGAGVDPFEHFMNYGYREGRNPSAEFDTRFYVQRYFQGQAEQNPLIHFLENRGQPGIYSRPPENEATIPAEIRRFTKPSSHFEEPRAVKAAAKKRAKVLCYYLTQFHAFPENDRWWGTGFTEWTNIARGVPRFKNHYQPRVPRDLGFYNLMNLDVMRRQVEMAQSAGVHGFVFYYYSFNGHRLMEKPLEQFLGARDIDMPFCLMWANENWTRRWDGEESEVLIAQNYDPEDDAALVADFARHFADPRYIRVGDRPLLMVYRPGIIPDSKETLARWRTLFRDNHGEDPILVMAQTFNQKDPTEFGLDGAIEFPPHKVTAEIRQVNDQIQLMDDTFGGQVFSYDDVVRHSLEEPNPPYPLIKTVVPSWDNDARRQGTGLVVHGSTPAKYERWLSALVERAQRERFFGESFVCVNAWNEWCEGAYLEPDLHFGSAYLNATGRAITGLSADVQTPRLLLVGHDAFPSGAQHLLLNIGRTLRNGFGIEVEYLLLGPGAMEDDYARVAPTTVVPEPSRLAQKILEFRERGFRHAVANTVVTGEAVKVLADAGIRVVLLVHELPRILKEKGLETRARIGMRAADQVIFAAEFVRDRTAGALGLTGASNFLIRPQGSYKAVAFSEEARAGVREELGLGPDDRLVIGVGYADMRKGFDLFLQTWRLMGQQGPGTHFCWIGDMDPVMAEWFGPEIEDAKASGTFHVTGYRKDVEAFFSAADAFVLTSREDPFPTVVLEALAVGLPVFAFDRSGGIPDFLREGDLGCVVPYGDTAALAGELGRQLSAGVSEEVRERYRATIEERFGFTDYVRDLLHVAVPDLPSISVVVPNYNYAHCMEERLTTIFEQSHPVEEIVVLDDASSDNSVSVICDVAQSRDRDVLLAVNEKNSGSVFAQWMKAAEMARGEFVWIAEADDLSERTFLSTLVNLMRTDPAIDIAFSDSRAIDMQGGPVFDSYKPYFGTIEPGALTRTQIFDGNDFVSRYLGIKNVILNVSSVLWRRDALRRALEASWSDLKRLRMAGDWRIYLEVLSWPGAKIAYSADMLNVHRRHSASVTHSLDKKAHVGEIRTLQEFAASSFKLPPRCRKAQGDYLREVTEQLLGSKQGAVF